MKLENKFFELSQRLSGDVLTDDITRSIYSTDASAYCENPLAVAYPADSEDIKKILDFCSQNRIGLTMRGAGTSLAGQVVGGGIIVDISKNMTDILEINIAERWVRVQPGVILDELNMHIKPHGLFFGPETSTSNRCNIGGMVGNNACGSHSLVYGSTREHLLELKCILSDGSEATFKTLTEAEFNKLANKTNLEGALYRNIRDILTDDSNLLSIKEGFPDPAITRRNTGYCLDILADTELFDKSSSKKFNFAKLLAGSEGTLAITTEIKLSLVDLPLPHKALVCAHLGERNDAFHANLVALRHGPVAIEMMDSKLLKLAETNLSQRNNKFFISGEPGAILMIEITGESSDIVMEKCTKLINDLKTSKYGYAYPIIMGGDIQKVWEFRKAGLGTLSNLRGDAKPVSLIEDTAVRPQDLPVYMEELTAMLTRYGKEVVLHAHIGTGELHVRPIINLKDESDVALFREIGKETALLVKRFRGSLSGEHGDGRLRGEFIPIVLGRRNFTLIEKVKKAWDPENILNPGVIVNTLPMNTFLRYDPGTPVKEPDTIFDFSSTGGIIRGAENCNGSADCRKSVKIGGIMCPSYMATGDEKNSTRARANILRQYLSDKSALNQWDHQEIYEILDLCLSCKGCKSECPSGVDVAKMKAEFLQHWYDEHGIRLRSFMIAYITSIYKLGSLFPYFFNCVSGNRIIGGTVKKLTGFATQRSIPFLYRITLRRWLKQHLKDINPKAPKAEVCLFVDEFTDFNDTETGIVAVKLLTALNYKVVTIKHDISGRTFISKGLIRRAARIAENNVNALSPLVSEGIPVVGIEPSAILSFRDEYPDLLKGELKEKALRLAQMSFTIDEFLASEFKSGRIEREMFSAEPKDVLVHIHCQQKAVGSISSTIEALSIPSGFVVREIPSGCCGMAGSFGYEKEHYDISNKIGELVLFPEVRAASQESVITASGTSCRHHIADGTGRKAIHSVQVLYDALLEQQKRP